MLGQLNSDDNFIIKAIEGLVRNTGYPVIGSVLKSIGVERSKLREMERKGLLKSMDLSFQGQILIGYYTDKLWPKRIPELREEPAERLAKD